MIGGVTRARAAALAVMVAPGAIAVSQARAQGELVLDPNNAAPGGLVTATQTVEEIQCPTFFLRWDSETGPILGQAEPDDGVAAVTFLVPEGTLGVHHVVSVCRSDLGNDTVVGRAVFEILAPPPPATMRPTTTVAGTHDTNTTHAPSLPVPLLPTMPIPSTVPTTSGPTTTAVPVGPPEDFAECERRTRQSRANLVYTPELRMEVGKSTRWSPHSLLIPWTPSLLQQ